MEIYTAIIQDKENEKLEKYTILAHNYEEVEYKIVSKIASISLPYLILNASEKEQLVKLLGGNNECKNI